MKIGYPCIIYGLSGYNLRGCVLANATPEKIREIAEHNLRILSKMIDFNINNKISLFRISSDIIPFASHPVNTLKWWDEFEDQLSDIGKKIISAKMRVSMHPGQYTVINSPNSLVVERAISDLEYHARFLDSLGVDISNKIIIHIGGVYGEKEASIERFKETYSNLSEKIKNRLIIENDERNYTVEEVLDIGESLGIPVVFDILHHRLNPSENNISETTLIERCNKTWASSDGRQKIHYSQQDAKSRPGAHSKTITVKEFIDFVNNIDTSNLDIMLEVKDKNISAVKCINSISQAIQESKNRQIIEKEWARYKYLVLSHSHKIYLKIRELLRDNKIISALDFYEIVDQGLMNTPLKSDEINAAQHVWGYFKKNATEGEKVKMNKLISEYSNDKININSIKRFLYKLAYKYDILYLKDNYYFLENY